MSQNAESSITLEDVVELEMTTEQSFSTRVRIDRFLASVQNSGYRMAHLATSNSDDALDLVQETMLQIVKRYSHLPDDQLKLLFYRILSSKITDWYRKTAFRNKFMAFFSKERYDQGDPVQHLTDDYELSASEQLDNSRMMESLALAFRQKV